MIKLSPERKADIRARCRAWRIANRYTTAQIAELAHTTRQAVSCFELNRGMSRGMLSAYIALGMPMSEIIDAAGINVYDVLEGSENG